MGIAFLRRQAALLEWALASLGKRRGKTAVLSLVLFLSVFLLSSLAFLRASVRLEAAEMLREAPDFVVQRQAAGRQEPVSRSAADAVRALPGVAQVRERLWGYFYDPLSGGNYTVAVPLDDPPAPGTAAVGNAVSRSRLIFRGDTLPLQSYGGETVHFAVSAVLPPRADFIAGDTLLVSEEDFRRLFSLQRGTASDLVVRLASGADPSAVRRGILDAVSGARVVTRDDLRASSASFLDGRRGTAAVLILAAALALLIVAADKPLAITAEEQQEMGVLRALGWSRGEVLAAKAWESLAVSIVAAPSGMLAAYAHVYLFGAALFAPVLRGWAVITPALFPVPVLDVPFLSAVAAAAVLLPAAGALLSARRSVSGDPDSAIRG